MCIRDSINLILLFAILLQGCPKYSSRESPPLKKGNQIELGDCFFNNINKKIKQTEAYEQKESLQQTQPSPSNNSDLFDVAKQGSGSDRQVAESNTSVEVDKPQVFKDSSFNLGLALDLAKKLGKNRLKNLFKTAEKSFAPAKEAYRSFLTEEGLSDEDANNIVDTSLTSIIKDVFQPFLDDEASYLQHYADAEDSESLLKQKYKVVCVLRKYLLPLLINYSEGKASELQATLNNLKEEFLQAVEACLYSISDYADSSIETFAKQQNIPREVYGPVIPIYRHLVNYFYEKAYKLYMIESASNSELSMRKFFTEYFDELLVLATELDKDESSYYQKLNKIELPESVANKYHKLIVSLREMMLIPFETYCSGQISFIDFKDTIQKHKPELLEHCKALMKEANDHKLLETLLARSNY